MTSFSQFGLAAPLLQALDDERYVTPTPIQEQAIPHVLAGRDLVGIAQTGTGKTAAFALPILNHLALAPRPPRRQATRVLILSPTRELSGQIQASFQTYGRHMPLRTTLVIGGVPMGKQIRAMATGVDVLVATPGRLMDLMQQRAIRLDEVEILVLDEADQMLDMGFIHAIRTICSKIPKARQSLFFSATMPPPIAELAAQLLREPARVAVTPVAKTADRVEQSVILIDRASKAGKLAGLLNEDAVERALIFTRTKRGADQVVRGLEKAGIGAEAIHGNKSQSQRERALGGFRQGRVKVLVATDIAARGIDVEGISHVFNYDLPNIPESYVHRIGRTARAGAAGIAISFCSDAEERGHLRAIEKLIQQRIPVSGPGAHLLVEDEAGAAPGARKRPQRRRGGGNGGAHGNGNSHGNGHGNNGGRADAQPRGRSSNGEIGSVAFLKRDRQSSPRGAARS